MKLVKRSELIAWKRQANRLAAAIELMTMPITTKTSTVDSLLNTIREDDERGKAALKSFIQFKEKRK